MRVPGLLLPVYDLINDSPVLGGSVAERNAGGFDAFVAHKISEECDVIATLQEALCKAVTEGERIYHRRNDAIQYCRLF